MKGSVLYDCGLESIHSIMYTIRATGSAHFFYIPIRQSQRWRARGKGSLLGAQNPCKSKTDDKTKRISSYINTSYLLYIMNHPIIRYG